MVLNVLARVTWIAYLVYAFAMWPSLFRLRYGRWPFAYSLLRIDRYSVIEASYAAALALFTAALMLGQQPQPASEHGGCAILAAGWILQVWSVECMKGNWRIGQDPSGADVRYVTHGPFRLLRHPIYVSLVLIAMGQTLLTGLDRRTWLLSTTTLVYSVVQGYAEGRSWKTRRRS